MPIVVLPELFAFVVHAPTVIASCAFLNSARFHGTHPDLQLATWWKPGQADCGLRSTATYTAATTEIAESRETPRSGCQIISPLLILQRGGCFALTHLVLGPSDARVSRRPLDHGSMAAVWLRRLPRASLLSAASSTLHLRKEFDAFGTRRRLGRV